MNKRTVVVRAGIVAGVASVIIVGGVWMYGALFSPIDDPRFFCQLPIATPVSAVTSYALLQNCAAGRTFTLARGEPIAVDLTDYFGVDHGPQWTDLTVSDGHVLATITAPSVIIDTKNRRVDEVAVYRASNIGVA